MALKNVFYGIGIVFLFLTIGYFVGTYLNNLASEIKAILAFLAAIILFVVGDYLRRINY